MLLQQHGRGASYVVALPPSAPAHVRPPPAPPRQGPASASTAPRPRRNRAAGVCPRRAPSRFRPAASARRRAASALDAFPEDGGEGGEGGALLGRDATLEGSDGGDDAYTLGGSALSGGVLDGGALGCGALMPYVAGVGKVYRTRTYLRTACGLNVLASFLTLRSGLGSGNVHYVAVRSSLDL